MRHTQAAAGVQVMLDLIERHYQAAGAPSLGWLARYDQTVMAPSLADLAALLTDQIGQSAAPSLDWMLRADAALNYVDHIARQDYPDEDTHTTP